MSGAESASTLDRRATNFTIIDELPLAASLRV
jgi:hypothetical protein